MHIKFLAHGTGSCRDAAKYLVQKNDHLGVARAGHEILRGDLNSVAELADSLDFKNRYTSCVIAFSDDDKPTREQIDSLIDDFELTAFPGLDADQYSFSVVRHDEPSGGCHLHIIAARVELHTGKSLNIAPPGHRKRFDPLRDFYNETYGWKSPDIHAHPENARLLQTRHGPFDLKGALNSGTEDVRTVITDFIMDGIVSGTVVTRTDLLNHLRATGVTVPRFGKNYISVKSPEMKRAVRLKGVLFDDKFNAQRAIEQENRVRHPIDRICDKKAADAARAELESSIERRAEYNRKEYKRVNQSLAATISDIEKESGFNLFSTSDRVDSIQHDHVGIDQLSKERNSELESRKTAVDAVVQKVPSGGPNVRREILRENRRKREKIQRFSYNEEIENERINNLRATIVEPLEKADGVDRIVKQSSDRDRENSARNRQTLEGVVEMINDRKQRQADELERFKTEINLVEYAARQGFQCDAKASTTESVVMRRNGEKIIISTNESNGHGIFWNPKEGGKSGTIIDFVQKYTSNGNLGHVRKELRSFSGESNTKTYYKPKPSNLESDRGKVLKAYANAEPVKSSNVFLKSRGLDSVKTDSRFSNIRQFSDESIVFPHFDGDGLSGYERRSTELMRFSTGGEKRLYCSMNINDAERIIICETAIDALSHSVLKPDENAAYVSFAGMMSKTQELYVRSVLRAAQDRKALITIAVDNDQTGWDFAAKLRGMLDHDVIVDAPRFKDFNEDLMNHIKLKQQPAPAPAPAPGPGPGPGSI